MAHRIHQNPLLSLFALVSLILITSAFASSNSDRTSWGHNITLGPQEQSADLTCFGCSIRVRGQVTGDVTAFFGNVVIEDQAEVAGDVTVFGSDIRLDQAVKVAGDVTVFGGAIHRDPQANVAGDLTAMGGRGWIIPMILAPFLILGLLIAFAIWLVQRLRRPSVPPLPA
jgi:hypothetical protein